jgi:hypothetical protein
MTTQYNSNFDSTYPFSNTTAQLALAVSTALSYTIPGTNATTYIASFSYPYNANVWVANNATATSPAAGTITTTGVSQLNPKRRYVRGGDVLSFISNAVVTDIGVSLLQL